MKIYFAQATDKGLVRENNEDYFMVAEPADGEPDSKGILFALADGLGGLEAGEVASREAVERLVGIYRGLGADPFPDWLAEAFQAVNAHVVRLNRGRTESPMATTLTACFFRSDQLQIAHVGDCRVYRYRAGRLECLTRDHSDRQRALTKVVGIDAQIQPDYSSLTVQAGDIYLSASDGLYGEISETEMKNALSAKSPEIMCRQLIECSLKRGGYDNATGQVIQIAG